MRMAGRLAQRPLGPLVEQLRKGGCAVTLVGGGEASDHLRPASPRGVPSAGRCLLPVYLRDALCPAPAAGWQPVGGGGRAGVGQLSPADPPGPGDLWPDAQRARGGLDDCFPGICQPRRGTGGGGLVQRGSLALPGHGWGERASPSPEWTWIPSGGQGGLPGAGRQWGDRSAPPADG